MSAITDTIGYLLEHFSQAEISRMTDIPQSTLSYVARGIRDLPTQYHSALYDVKESVSYSQLFNVGVPSVQASLLALQPVSNVKDNLGYVNAVADQLTMGYIVSLANRDDVQMSEQEIINRYYSDARDSIVSALQRSTKPISDWDDYLSSEYER